MAFYNSGELSQTPTSTLPKWLWLIPFMATLLLEGCYHLLIRTAKQQNSPALAAEAVHYRVDSITSVFACLALLATLYAPSWTHFFDHLGAIFISLFMVILGVYAARKNMHQLFDHIPSATYFERVKQAPYAPKESRALKRYACSFLGPMRMLTSMWR